MQLIPNDLPQPLALLLYQDNIIEYAVNKHLEGEPMTTTEFKIKMKEALDQADLKKEKVLITRGGKVYEVVRVN